MHNQPLLRLTEVKLERFKAAFKPDPVPIGAFNVVIGRNGSGKSTLLEALQWIDNTLRQDARVASERYHGIHDLINLRSRAERQYFELGLRWHVGNDDSNIAYRVRVRESFDGMTPEIFEEEMVVNEFGVESSPITTSNGKRLGPHGGVFEETDRLALGRLTEEQSSQFPRSIGIRDVQKFWQGAVFLRLSANRLAQGSLARRKSYEPLLDEEGQNLPALLNELSTDELEDLVKDIQTILSDIRGIDVSKPLRGRDERVFYSLLERMPYRGKTGRSQFPIPAWMLSEGTRRITALLALLRHSPAPSLLCIEEIENGLDPWTVISILNHLQSAAASGVQVIVTTHSPWLLDHVPVSSILSVERTEGSTVYSKFENQEDVRSYQGRVSPGAIYVAEGK